MKPQKLLRVPVAAPFDSEDVEVSPMKQGRPTLSTTKKKRKEGSSSSRSRNKAPGYPLRPLNSYTLFFLAERERILKGTDKFKLPFTEEEVAQISYWNQIKPKRVHRKTHGKIDFQNLTDTIVMRWKKISPRDRQVFANQALIERSMYEAKVQKWKEDTIISSSSHQKSLPSEIMPGSLLSELYAQQQQKVASAAAPREEHCHHGADEQEGGPKHQQERYDYQCVGSSGSRIMVASSTIGSNPFFVVPSAPPVAPPLHAHGDCCFSSAKKQQQYPPIAANNSADDRRPLQHSLINVMQRHTLPPTTPAVSFGKNNNNSNSTSSFSEPLLEFPQPLNLRHTTVHRSSSLMGPTNDTWSSLVHVCATKNTRMKASVLNGGAGCGAGAGVGAGDDVTVLVPSTSPVAAKLQKEQEPWLQNHPASAVLTDSIINCCEDLTRLLDPLDPNEMDCLF